jgi:NAD(P)H-dependent FMN reductase
VGELRVRQKNKKMRIVCISSSLSPTSRSETLGRLCVDALIKRGVDAEIVSLKGKIPSGFDDSTIYESSGYLELHELTAAADGLIFASPVYNWGLCAELKKFVECIGSTPEDGSRKGAFFDKVITFVVSAGLPHSYMASASMANSMMMDFKCIINPYTAYIHNRHWEGDELIDEARLRLEKSMMVMEEMTSLLAKRTYSSKWEI